MGEGYKHRQTGRQCGHDLLLESGLALVMYVPSVGAFCIKYWWYILVVIILITHLWYAGVSEEGSEEISDLIPYGGSFETLCYTKVKTSATGQSLSDRLTKTIWPWWPFAMKNHMNGELWMKWLKKKPAKLHFDMVLWLFLHNFYHSLPSVAVVEHKITR